ncbi:MAG: glycoside hydrolase family 57 protein [Gammaproteobacteria bacterium]
MEMLTIIGELIAGVVPRYQRLAARGQAELAVTPYAHPIAPLLIDFTAAREAQSGVVLPAAAAYPGGVERARWHVEKATLVFEHVFGQRPQGCWPAEGAVSTPFLALLDEHKFSWTATGRATIGHSLANSGAMSIDTGAHRVQGTNVACFHGDDGLSDLIGFTYSSWTADDAVNDLITRLRAIHRAQRNIETAVVAVIAAGDATWQNYPRNGWEFVHTLYRRLSDDSQIELTTFHDALLHGAGIGTLPRLVAGSGSYGNFSGWIGEAESNAIWERLCEAKRVVDEVFALGTVSDIRRREIEQQLAICESSNWFGKPQSRTDTITPAQRQRLFYRQVLRLYQLLSVRPPVEVQTAAAVLGNPGASPI